MHHEAKGEWSMSVMAKLNLKTVERAAPEDPVQARRRKLVAALDEQQLVLKALLKGESLLDGNPGSVLSRNQHDEQTAREIEYLSGRTSVMVRAFSVNNNQVNGYGDNLIEQARPLIQVEDLREMTGGVRALLHTRDRGFFNVDAPNYWERPELSGYLRDLRQKPDHYAHLEKRQMEAPLYVAAHDADRDMEIEDVLARLRGG